MRSKIGFVQDTKRLSIFEDFVVHSQGMHSTPGDVLLQTAHGIEDPMRVLNVEDIHLAGEVKPWFDTKQSIVKLCTFISQAAATSRLTCMRRS